MRGALAGLRVVDCSRLIAGGVLATILADHGADVVKVENPRGGDPLRTWLKERGELWWKVYARGKRSITLNLAHPRGQTLLTRLVKDADVLVENFVPGTLEKWGLGWEVLSAENPRLVLARRTLGVASAAYAGLHLSLYVIDQHFDWFKVASEIVLRFYLLIGAIVRASRREARTYGSFSFFPSMYT